MDANLLSDREIEVLRLVGQGKSNKEIAMDLDISVNTVHVHISRIFKKINVTSRTGATLYAIENGIISPALPPDNQEPENNTIESDSLPAEMKYFVNKTTILGMIMLAIVIFAFVMFMVSRPNKPTKPTSMLMVDFTNEDRWVAYAPLPLSRSNMATTTYESNIYVISGTSDNEVSNRVDAYSQATNSWTTLQDKPTPVTESSAVLVGEKILVPGGKTKDGVVTDKLEVFDPRRNLWEEKANLPTGLSDYALATFGGSLYLFGGWDGSQASEITLKYNPEQDIWSELTGLPHALTSVIAVQSENRIVLIGNSKQTTSQISMLNYFPDRDLPGENPWEEGVGLPTTGSVSCLFELLGEIYAAVDIEEGTQFFIYDVQQNVWSAIGNNKSLNTKDSRCSVIGGELFIFGGTNTDGKDSDQLLGYKMIYSISLPGIVK